MPEAGRVGDQAQCPADSHGCPGCAHSVMGPASAGSPDVLINYRAALRVGDPGIHSACCGGNSWNAAQGSPTVFINGKAVHRLGDMTAHCGGTGKLITGSPDVIVGDWGVSQEIKLSPILHDQSLTVRLVDAIGRRIRGATLRVHCPHKEYEVQSLDEEVTLQGLCEGASVVLKTMLQQAQHDLEVVSSE